MTPHNDQPLQSGNYVWDAEQNEYVWQPQQERAEPQVGEVWRHYKGGEYEIVALATNEMDLSPCIVYRSMDTGRQWVRSLFDFMSSAPFTFSNGVRFERIHSAPQPARCECGSIRLGGEDTHPLNTPEQRACVERSWTQPARGEELVERVAGHIRSRLIFQHEEYVRDLARDIVALCTSEPAQPLAGMEEFEAAAYNYRRVHNSSADAAMQRLLSLYRRALECVPSEEILQLLKHMANEDYAAAHVIDEPDASHLKAQSARMLAYVARVREARRP